MLLRHGGFCSVEDVLNERWAVRKFNFPAIDITCVFVVDEEEVVASVAAADVNVFPEFHIPLGAKDGKSSVAPRVEAFRCEPIDAEISRTSITSYGGIAKILDTRILLIIDVAHL